MKTVSYGEVTMPGELMKVVECSEIFLEKGGLSWDLNEEVEVAKDQ